MSVVVTIATALFATTLLIYNFANRSRGVTASARALQTALLIQERFCEDLARLVPAAAVPVAFTKEDPARLAFWCHDPAGSSAGALGVRAVKYALPKAPGLLMREWDQRVEALGAAPLESIRFLPFVGPTGLLVRVTLVVGREPGEPPGPAATHSFLARIPSPPFHKRLKLKMLSGFLEAGDAPKAGELPGI